MKSLLLPALAIAISFTTISCSDKKDSSSPSVAESQEKAKEVKPCELVTKAEVEAAFGAPIKDGEEKNLVVKTCNFSSASDEIKSFADNVQIQVQPVQVFDGTHQANTQNQNIGFKIETVSGVGEDAFFQIPDSPGAVAEKSTLLGFKKKDVAIYISVSRNAMTLDQVKSAEKDLAQKAASRL